MRTKVMAANWKMYKNPDQTREFFRDFLPLVSGHTRDEIVVCPPFLDLPSALEAAKGSNVAIGGQNVHWKEEGAFTGETSAALLLALGVTHVIIGHSERRQCVRAFHAVSAKKAAKLIVAYEPVWAIGTGKTATPEMAAEAHAVIRREATEIFGEEFASQLRILYGGSVKPDNASTLMSQEEIDGALVGGASLDPKSFTAILEYLKI